MRGLRFFGRWWRLFSRWRRWRRLDSGSKEDSGRSIGSETLAFFFGGPVLDYWPLEELAPAMVSDLLVL